MWDTKTKLWNFLLKWVCCTLINIHMRADFESSSLGSTVYVRHATGFWRQMIWIFKTFRSSSVRIHLKDKTAVIFVYYSYSWTYLYSHKREKVQIKLGPQFLIVVQVPGTGVFLSSLPRPFFLFFFPSFFFCMYCYHSSQTCSKWDHWPSQICVFHSASVVCTAHMHSRLTLQLVFVSSSEVLLTYRFSFVCSSCHQSCSYYWWCKVTVS